MRTLRYTLFVLPVVVIFLLTSLASPKTVNADTLPPAGPACTQDAECSAPGQLCLPSGFGAHAGTPGVSNCDYPAGSPAANCYDSCTGTCTITASGGATCDDGSSTNTPLSYPNCYPNQVVDQCHTGESCQPTSGNPAVGVCILDTPGGNDGGLPTGGNTTPYTGGGINPTAIKAYGDSIQYIINVVLVPVLIAVAFLIFLWGVFKYFILGGDNEEQRTTGRQFVIWAVIGFAIIFSLWGLVNLVLTTLSITPGGNHPAPPTL